MVILDGVLTCSPCTEGYHIFLHTNLVLEEIFFQEDDRRKPSYPSLLQTPRPIQCLQL